MSEFSERLSGLMFERNLTRKGLAQALQISAACLTHYLQDKHVPTVGTLVLIADYFQRSTDFLLGREEENTSLSFHPCPPFSEQIARLKKVFGCSSYEIYTKAGISKSCYYDWKSAIRQPSLENVTRLADYFGRRVDFILGRES